jgi:hypothetical protein
MRPLRAPHAWRWGVCQRQRQRIARERIERMGRAFMAAVEGCAAGAGVCPRCNYGALLTAVVMREGSVVSQDGGLHCPRCGWRPTSAEAGAN